MIRPPARAAIDVADLIRDGLASAADATALQAAAQDFAIRITPEMRRAIAPGAATTDPVARQFLPAADELLSDADALRDPIGDARHSPVSGVTHRYPDRVILHVTRVCDVHCRFCFRREVVGESGPLPAAELTAALAYIAATPAIREVILTGGDPLTLSPRRIAALLARLAAIAHVEVLRIHTRVPVVAPARVNPDLIAALKLRLPVFVAIHANHEAELTPAACAALARLADAGIPLISQTVLLKGVNDSAAVLAALFRGFARNRVKPYYLHHCDLARGAGHFRTTITAGQRLMAELGGQISGLCLPRYVLDIPGGYGKVPLTPDHVRADGGPGRYLLRDHRGGLHRYLDPGC